MNPDDPSRSRTASAEAISLDDAGLVRQMRAGDPEAGRCFVRRHYAAIYRYLLALTGRPEFAEDLTQETFLQAWRRLDTFTPGAPLRPWLHRIAHREFLQALRRRRPEAGLDEVGEIAAPGGAAWIEGIELRVLMARLPVEERELVVLHDLEGYTSAEIGRVVGKPAGTVRCQLAAARARLRRELGEGDLPYLNPAPEAVLQRWAGRPPEASLTLQAHRAMVDRQGERRMWHDEKQERKNRDKTGTGMSRRQLLEAAGSAAAAAAAASLTGAGAAAAPNEAEIIDDRLTQKVTLALKATALSDVCERLRAGTGVRITAGPSVADEKVTVFCEKRPLREVMGQLSRPFGYAWLRTGQAFRPSTRGASDGVQALGKDSAGLNARTPERLNADYRYELVQDLRSQLLEEELRNWDLNAALLALDAQMQEYRPYLDTSYDALHKLWEQGGEPARLLSSLVHNGGWGGIQLYHRLTARDRAALVAGEELTFRPDAPDPDRRLPDEWQRPMLEALSHRIDAEGRLVPLNVVVSGAPALLSALPGIRLTQLRLKLDRSELGQVSLVAMMVTAFNDAGGERLGFNLRSLATSRSPSGEKPDNAGANARLRSQAPFDRRVTVQPLAACREPVNAGPSSDDPRFDRVIALASPHVSSAEVWEAVHRATGLPVVADFYTRLYPLEPVTARDQTLFAALCAVGDALGMRWRYEDGFLVSRGTRFFWDKLKEVPNRYLQRWVRQRDASGGLPLAGFLEMGSMTDRQLDSTAVAEGIEHCWGLREWAWLGGGALEGRVQREHARFLATLTPDQQRRTQEARGLPVADLTPAQQQGVLRLHAVIQEALEREEGAAPPVQPEDLLRARLTARYAPAGWFAALVPAASGREPPGAAPADLVAGRTAAEAIAAPRRLSPEPGSPEVRRLPDGYFRAEIEF